MRWDLVLERRSRNRLNADTTHKKLKRIASSAERNQTLGFRGRVGRLREPELVTDEETKDEVYRYLVRLRLEKPVVRSEDAAARQFEHVRGVVEKCANSEGWRLLEGKARESDKQEAAPVSEPVQAPRQEFVVPPLTEEAKAVYFAGIYERDEHIRTIHSAVETMVETDGELTNHVLLYGLPGACKTVLCERFKAWYEQGSQVTRVAFVDGTTMSKAGLENWLLDLADADQMPDILVVDELEKQPTENLSVLNGAMGSGVLAKLNAVVKNRRHKVRFLVAGICNDVDALQKSSLGKALWSRFSNKLPCVRPSRELCLHILSQMAERMPHGSRAWAEAALEFGWDVLKERDIRELKRHLSGRDRLLTGEWQEDQRRILEAKKREDASIRAQEHSPAESFPFRSNTRWGGVSHSHKTEQGEGKSVSALPAHVFSA